MKQLITKINKGEVTSLCADAISELERAVRLFPVWPAELSHYTEDKEELLLNCYRDVNNHEEGTGTTIFSEEFIEFIQAARKPGNKVAARIELVQAMAMLIRIGCHLNDYVPHRVTENTEVSNG